MTLAQLIKNLREAWYARDNDGAEYYLSCIMDEDWSSKEFLDALLIPAVKWMEQDETRKRLNKI